ncbi:hypothetical protein ACYOEI_37570, partial [Singulisphaera rosea]
MTRVTASRWRPTLRVSFRWFLVLAAVATLAVWRVTDQPKRRGRAIATTKQAGGVVQLDGEDDPIGKPSLAPKTVLPRWISDRLGVELGHKVSVVNLDGQPVTDADLASFEAIQGLRKLDLNGTPVTDQGLAHLAGLVDLEELQLRETTVGDPGLRHLVGLDRLRALYLYETKVGDPGMASLARLHGLEELSLSRTAVG